MRYINRYPVDLETEPNGSAPSEPGTDAALGDEPAPGDAMSADPVDAAADTADTGPPGDQEPEPPLWTTADGHVVHLPRRAVDWIVVGRPPRRPRPPRPGILPPLERLRRRRAIKRVGRLIRQATRLGPRAGAGGPGRPVFAARLAGRNFRIVTRPRGLRHEILSVEPEVTPTPGLDDELGTPPEPTTTVVPFAPPPPAGSYWPLITTHPQDRVVSYLTAAKKTIGRSGRRFMAGRLGARKGVRNTPRHHCGIDLFARRRETVIACEDGTIREFAFFYKAKSGQRTFRLLIEHARCVVNYGELMGDSLSRTGLKVGSRVSAGQVIGYVSDTDMLHFETYRLGTTTSHQWWKGSPPPAQLLNPTRYVLDLSQQGRSAGTTRTTPQPELEFSDLGGEAREGGLGAGEIGRDASLAAIAERVAARRPIRGSAMEFENEKPAPRWSRCFKVADVERVRTAYQDNSSAAGANSVDRCSCIVMLNVALGQLLKLKTKESRARGGSSRRVQMGALTTETIEKAMAQLRRAGYARPATVIDFFDRRNKTAGTLKPERLKKSVQKAVLDLSTTRGCWYAYALSIMDGYHSVLLLVDKTGNDGKIYWLDQFSSNIDDEVTTTLDQRITTKTQGWWQAVMDSKKVGYNTPARIWPLRRRISP